MPRDAAGGIIVNKEGKIALVWQNKNSWSFPKGGIDGGETPLEAAWREIKEETGLGAPELIFVKELGSFERYSIGKDGTGEDTSRPPGTRTFFLFKTEETALKPQEADVTEAKWVTIEEACALLTHPKDAEFLKSVRGAVEDAVE